jgi:hypothetical protein
MMNSSSLTPEPRADEVAPFTWPKGETPMATQFRSAWLTSSLRVLRRRKLAARYFDALSDDHHDDVREATLNGWLSIDVAMAHYAACDALGLPEDEQMSIGHEVAMHAHRKSHALALRKAGQAAITPWTAFALQRRLWLRFWRGGDIATFKDGPNNARIEIVGWPCSRFPYVRQAMRGVLLGQTTLLCASANIELIDSLCTPTTLGYRATWT